MKRRIRRDVSLAPFSLGLAELGLLWTRLEPLFVNDKEKSFYVDVEFEGETLTVESLEELRTAAYPRSKSTNFTLHCHGSECSVHLYTPPHAGRQPKLIVTSDSEVWAAGAREVVLTVINQNRAWHHWLRPKGLETLLLCFVYASVGAFAFIQGSHLSVRPAQAFGLFGVVLVCAWIVFGRPRLFPLATLRLKEAESFWRRYSVELTLAFALLSLLLAAYGIFAPKIFG